MYFLKNIYISIFAFRETPDEVEIIKVVCPKNTVKSKNVVVNLKSAATVNHEPSPHQQPQNVNKNLPNYQNQASAMPTNSMQNNPAFKSNAAQFVYQVEFSDRMSCEESAIFFANLAYIPHIIQNQLFHLLHQKLVLNKVIKSEVPAAF